MNNILMHLILNTIQILSCDKTYKTIDHTDFVRKDIVDCIEISALSGDSEAALWLSGYFDSNNEIIESDFWLQFSAHLNNCDGISNLYRRFKSQKTSAAQKEYLKWKRTYDEKCSSHMR